MSKRKKAREAQDAEPAGPRFTRDMIVWDALEAHPGVEAVLLEPLPFEEPDELTLLWTRNEEQNQEKSHKSGDVRAKRSSAGHQWGLGPWALSHESRGGR